MEPTTVVAIVVVAISVIGALASAGGSVIGFVRGLKKLIISWITEPIEVIKRAQHEHEKLSDRQISDLQAEVFHTKQDASFAREDAQELRREVSELRRQIISHVDNEDRHV